MGSFCGFSAVPGDVLVVARGRAKFAWNGGLGVEWDLRGSQLFVEAIYHRIETERPTEYIPITVGMSSEEDPMKVSASVLIASLSLGLVSCATSGGTGGGPPSVVALPNGYYLQRDKATDVDLVKRGGSEVVRGPIAAYDVDGNLVVGCVGKWPERG